MPSKRPSAQGDALAKLATQVVTLLKRPETQAAIAAAVKTSSSRFKQFTAHRANRTKTERPASDDRFSLPLSKDRLERRISTMEENLRLLASELADAVDLTSFDELLRKARLKLKVAEEMSLMKRAKVHYEVDSILDDLDNAVLIAVDGGPLD